MWSWGLGVRVEWSHGARFFVGVSTTVLHSPTSSSPPFDLVLSLGDLATVGSRPSL